MTDAPPWLATMREITGTVAQHDNPVILAWPKFIAQAYPDMAAYCAGYTHDAISWCGLTVGYCMAKAGIRPVFGPTPTDKFLWALSWLKFGAPVNSPEPGDVLIYDFGGGDHHVTLFENSTGYTYVCRGGNQSHQVKVSNYPARQCLGIRRPPAGSVVIAPPRPAPVPIDQPAGLTSDDLLFRLAQWALNQGGHDAALAAFKASVRADLAAIEAKIDAFSLSRATVVPPPVMPPDPAQPTAKSPAPTPKPPPSDGESRFERCLLIILKEEGGNDDDPQDHGGRTSRGITQREYDAWRKRHGLPTRDVWTADDKEVRNIYHDDYWLPHCPTLGAGVDLCYFNICVNGGPGRAAQLYAKSIGSNDAETVAKFCDALVAFYRSAEQFPRYGRGWLARTARIRTAATQMVKESAMNAAPVVVDTQPASASKVNQTQLAQVVTQAAALWIGQKLGLDATMQGILQLALASGLASLTAVMRTYFTTKLTAQSAAKVSP